MIIYLKVNNKICNKMIFNGSCLVNQCFVVCDFFKIVLFYYTIKWVGQILTNSGIWNNFGRDDFW